MVEQLATTILYIGYEVSCVLKVFRKSVEFRINITGLRPFSEESSSLPDRVPQ